MEIEGRRLQRHWLVTPLRMTLLLLAIFYGIACFAIITGAPSYAPVSLGTAIVQAGSLPLILAAFFGFCGILGGSLHSAGARALMDRAFGVEPLEDEHWIAKRVHDFAQQLDLPPPAVGVMDTANAYAVGVSVNDAAVVIGKPLIETLDSEELDAVIGHELGHIATGDMRRMQMAEGYQSMFVAFVGGVVVMTVNRVVRTRLGQFLGYMFARLTRQSLFLGTELMVKQLSRRREYYADAVGALLTSREAMVGALRKLHDLPAEKQATREYGHLMLRGGSFSHLLATHPSLHERVSAIETGSYITQVLARAGRVRNAPETPVEATAGTGPAVAEDATAAPQIAEEIAPPEPAPAEGMPAEPQVAEPALALAEVATIATPLAEDIARTPPIEFETPDVEQARGAREIRDWELQRAAAATSAALVLQGASLLFDLLMALWPLSLLAAAAIGFFTTLAWLS